MHENDKYLHLEKVDKTCNINEHLSNSDFDIKEKNILLESQKSYAELDNVENEDKKENAENENIEINSNSEYALKSCQLLNNISDDLKKEETEVTNKSNSDNFIKVDNYTIKLEENLGKGSFGHVFKAYNEILKLNIAVKIESKSSLVPQLEHEYKIFTILSEMNINPNNTNVNNSITSNNVNTNSNLSNNNNNSNFNKLKCNLNGIPTFYYFKSLGNYNFLFIEELNKSLEDLLKIHKKFSLNTIVNISYQLVSQY